MSPIVRAIEIAGSDSALARAIGVTPPFVRHMRTGMRPIPPGLCPDIERSTGVTCEVLRPDLTWIRSPDGTPLSYTRNAKPARRRSRRPTTKRHHEAVRA